MRANAHMRSEFTTCLAVLEQPVATHALIALIIIEIDHRGARIASA